MLDVAVIVLYRMICFVGRQRPFDRVENNVLGSPQSQVQLKPDFSHPWYFLQLNFCQGECEGVVMDIERATFNGGITPLNDRGGLIGVDNGTIWPIEVIHVIAIDPTSKFPAFEEIDLRQFTQILCGILSVDAIDLGCINQAWQQNQECNE